MGVCCIKAANLPENIIDKTDSFAVPVDFLANSDIHWIERNAAETDTDYKQLIPYVILQRHDKKIASYMRHGTEKRLHGLYSCGFGGHVEEGDKDSSIFKTLEKGKIRELSEEISNFDNALIDLEYKGLINEVETQVGLVHLGIVYLGKCKTAFVPQESDETKGLEWKSLEELKQFKSELWTKLALNLL